MSKVKSIQFKIKLYLLIIISNFNILNFIHAYKSNNERIKNTSNP